MPNPDPKRPGLLLATALCSGVLLAASPALAVDDLDLFELDENAADPAPGLPDDWETVNNGGGNSNENAFIPDTSGNADNVLTGGTTKDDIDITQWQWKFAKATPDKDNITNAYAAAYQDADNNLIIYFGADRFAVNGDAQMGFWFLQNPIGTTDPAGGGSNGTFTGGGHEDGDILVLANFVSGGSVGVVQVYEWVEGAGTEGNDNLVRLGDFGDCNGGPDDACAVTNDANTQAFWPYTPKSGPSGIFPPAGFFEGGINISAFFGGEENTPCFTTFLAESRSSASVDAVLKDFTIGEFEVCETAALKVCNQDPEDAVFVPATGEVQYQVAGLVTNTGLGSATVTSVTDSPAFDSGSLVLFELTGDPGTTPDYDGIVAVEGATITLPYDLAPNGVFGWKATITGSNGVMDTVTVASESTVGGTALDDATADAECPIKKVDAGLSVTKECAANLVPIDPGVDDRLMVEITIQGTVTNEGEIALTNVTVVDETYGGLGLFGPATLEPEETQPWGPVTINPTTDREPATAPICRFTDDVRATGEADINFTNESATCIENEAGTAIVCTATFDATCALCGISVGE